MGNKKVKSKTKSASKIVNPKNKTCKNFCKKVFIPEKERVAIEFSNKFFNKGKLSKRNVYKPIKVLRKTKRDKPLAKFLEDMYLKGCNDVYCQKSCKNHRISKDNWLKSFTKERKEKLIQQGPISGCIDLIKEFPKHYKNI